MQSNLVHSLSSIVPISSTPIALKKSSEHRTLYTTSLLILILSPATIALRQMDYHR